MITFDNNNNDTREATRTTRTNNKRKAPPDKKCAIQLHRNKEAQQQDAPLVSCKTRINMSAWNYGTTDPKEIHINEPFHRKPNILMNSKKNAVSKHQVSVLKAHLCGGKVTMKDDTWDREMIVTRPLNQRWISPSLGKPKSATLKAKLKWKIKEPVVKAKKLKKLTNIDAIVNTICPELAKPDYYEYLNLSGCVRISSDIDKLIRPSVSMYKDSSSPFLSIRSFRAKAPKPKKSCEKNCTSPSYVLCDSRQVQFRDNFFFEY